MSVTARNWLLERASITPHRLALKDGDEQLSFAQLAAQVDEMAASLVTEGILPRQRISILAEGADLIQCLHAITRVGGVAVPLNARLNPVEHVAQLEAVNAVGLAFGGVGASTAHYLGMQLARHVEGIAASLDPLALTQSVQYLCLSEHRDVTGQDGIPASDPPAGEHPALAESFELDSIHAIIFTSGTTGVGKPVALTFGNHWWNAFGSALNLGSPAEDVWLGCMPLYHVGGISMLIKSVLYGVPIIVHRHFEAEAVDSELEAGNATMVSLVSTMLYRLIEHRGGRTFPDSLRCVLLGGGPIAPDLVQVAAEMALPIAPTYGLTETGSQAATLRPSDVWGHPRSAGRALLGVDVAIQRDGAPSDDTGIGEIIVRGPSVSPGYVSQGSLGLSIEPLPQPWFATGDLGSVDVAGFLSVSDRRVDLIVTGGENVYPSEVEGILSRHPKVAEVAVFATNDPEWGQVVAAAIVPCDESLTEGEINGYCRESLPGFKCPRLIQFVSCLPRTGSGKVRRRELRNGFRPFVRESREK